LSNTIIIYSDLEHLDQYIKFRNLM